ncbi:MAG: DNA primase [Pseudomonadota bacterium]
MAGLIPRHFIDDLLARVDIVDVIDARVPLKKAGANHKACCPFHSEKTPSFTVSQSKQFYHCFGCGAHGTAVGFLMEYENLEFPEAIEELAKSLGIDVPREESGQQHQQRKQSADLYQLLKAASDYYQQQLRHHPEAVEYLKDRGLSGQVAKDYAIGFAPDAWDFLLTRLGKRPEEQKKLESAGLLIRNERGRVYDRFRGRVMFPIRDPRGKTIAFGGRVLGDGEPKYLNSPETPVYHKGRELYGLYEAKKHNRQLDKLLVVEGYMDVVMLAQHGIRNTVATLGTACTADHMQRLFRSVDEVVFCFDGDRAGRDAAWRALNNTLPALQDGKQVRFLFLPEGEDPDSLVQTEGREAFENRLTSDSLPLSKYLIRQLGEQCDTSSIDGISRFAELAKPLLAKIQAETFSRLLREALADAVGVPASQLFGERGLASIQTPTTTTAASRRTTARSQLSITPTRLLIAALIAQPGLAQTVTDEDLAMVATLDEKGIPFILELFHLLQSNSTLSPAALLDRYRDTPYQERLLELASHEFQSEENIAIEFQDAFANLLRRARKQRRQLLLQRPLSQLTASEKAFLRSFKD